MEPMDDTVVDPVDDAVMPEAVEEVAEEAVEDTIEVVVEETPAVEAPVVVAPEPVAPVVETAVLPPEANVPVKARTTAESHYTRRERRLLQGVRAVGTDPGAKRGDGRDASEYVDEHSPRKPHFGRFQDQMPYE